MPIPCGVVRVIIDNQKVVGKTHSVRVENKVPVSVITSQRYLCIDRQSVLQETEALKPSNWQFREPTKEQKLLMENFLQNPDQDHLF